MNVKTTLREIRQMLNTGEALPLKDAPQDGGHTVIKIAHSEGVYGISGGVVSVDGVLYAVAARTTDLFRWF